jgi:hypothetical protein
MKTEEKAREDFRVFLYLVWKFLNLPPPTPLQYELADYLQDTGIKRKCLMAFRGIGKSYVTAAYTLWRLYRDPDENILVVSASKDRSDAFSRFAKMLVTEMPMIRHLRPTAGHGFDSIEKFTVGTAVVSQSPSVKSVGLYGQITGARANVIIADDVEIPGNSESQLQRDKLAERTKEFSAILKPEESDEGDNQIIFLGTPQTEDSLYNKLTDRGYDIRIWPARLPAASMVDKYPGQLGPSILERIEEDIPPGTPTDTRFDEGELMEREAEYGRSGFALQFQLDTSLSDADRYPLKLSDMVVMDVDREVAPAKIVWGSNPRDNGIEDIPMLGLQGDRYFTRVPIPDEKWLPYSGSVMAIDPSGRGLDETGYCVAKMLNGTIFIRRCGGFKGGYEPKNLAKLAKIAKEEKVNLIISEPNFGDGMWSELFKPVLREIYPVDIEDSPRATGQKELRIIDILEPLLNQHRLVFDRALLQRDAREQDETDQHFSHRRLAHQLTRMTKERGALRHDDRVEALAIAARYWVEQVAVSADEAVAEHLEELREQELEKFMEHVLDKPKNSSQDDTWLSPMGL